jgi:hypothetical protein
VDECGQGDSAREGVKEEGDDVRHEVAEHRPLRVGTGRRAHAAPSAQVRLKSCWIDVVVNTVLFGGKDACEQGRAKTGMMGTKAVECDSRKPYALQIGRTLEERHEGSHRRSLRALIRGLRLMMLIHGIDRRGV